MLLECVTVFGLDAAIVLVDVATDAEIASAGIFCVGRVGI